VQEVRDGDVPLVTVDLPVQGGYLAVQAAGSCRLVRTARALRARLGCCSGSNGYGRERP